MKNIGEWSEVYVFFRLLGDCAIFPCDGQLVRTDESFPVKRIIRGDREKDTCEFVLDTGGDMWIVKKVTPELRIKSAEGTEHADELLSQLVNRGENYSKALKFLDYIGVKSIKASSQAKEDIKLQIADVRAGQSPVCGFSIKSYLGRAPTLLNSSGDCTNLLYEVTGISPDRVDEVNAEPQTNDLLGRLARMGASLRFAGLCSEVFRHNLLYIDSSMEQILGELVKISYTGNIASIREATEKLSEADPLRLKYPDPYREYVKRLLTAVALGMTPGHEWTGRTDSTAGFLIVKPNGEVVSYHIYNTDAFKDYLFLYTRFDRPSRSRHKYGKLYVENERVFIKLALQIRFDKP